MVDVTSSGGVDGCNLHGGDHHQVASAYAANRPFGTKGDDRYLHAEAQQLIDRASGLQAPRLGVILGTDHDVAGWHQLHHTPVKPSCVQQDNGSMPLSMRRRGECCICHTIDEETVGGGNIVQDLRGDLGRCRLAGIVKDGAVGLRSDEDRTRGAACLG